MIYADNAAICISSILNEVFQFRFMKIVCFSKNLWNILKLYKNPSAGAILENYFGQDKQQSPLYMSEGELPMQLTCIVL